MLAIRLTRTGKRHSPHYRIVVQEKRSKLDGKTIDIVGHYHPAQNGKALVMDKEKTEKWLKQGAQPSDTVTNLLVKEGLLPKESKVHNFFTPKAKTEITAAKDSAVTNEVKAKAEEKGEESEEAVEATETEETIELPENNKETKTSEEDSETAGEK